MRFFNTTGPVNPADHYCLPPLERLDLDKVLLLIQQEKYFSLYAPHRSGKTSTLLALMDYLNHQGRYRCVYMSMEVGHSAREDVAAAMEAIAGELAERAETVLNDDFVTRHWPEALAESGPFGAFGQLLGRWSARDAKPLVLLIDDFDSLVGDTMNSVLRQLRAGHLRRPDHFPQSVLLCGVRDVRDYRIRSDAGKAPSTGGSVFNIKAASLRLSDFSPSEVEALYRQHTEATGQVVTPEALERISELTQGQPWLVNALGYKICFEHREGLDRSRPITPEDVEQAKETLIRGRESPVVQLADKLQQERVRQIIEPLLSSEDTLLDIPRDDLDYVRELGLIRSEGFLQIANPMYREIISRQLTFAMEQLIAQEPAWYTRADQRLDLEKLLAAFQAFFREESEHWMERLQYQEAGPQLLMQAFLQRIVNGGGRIEREYGLGRKRTDLLVIWPWPGGVQKAVIELKVLHKSLEQTLAEGLRQTWEYMDRCGTEEGHLVVFDRAANKPWEEKLFRHRETVQGRIVVVWGM